MITLINTKVSRMLAVVLVAGIGISNMNLQADSQSSDNDAFDWSDWTELETIIENTNNDKDGTNDAGQATYVDSNSPTDGAEQEDFLQIPDEIVVFFREDGKHVIGFPSSSETPESETDFSTFPKPDKLETDFSTFPKPDKLETDFSTFPKPDKLDTDFSTFPKPDKLDTDETDTEDFLQIPDEIVVFFREDGKHVIGFPSRSETPESETDTEPKLPVPAGSYLKPSSQTPNENETDFSTFPKPDKLDTDFSTFPKPDKLETDFSTFPKPDKLETDFSTFPKPDKLDKDFSTFPKPDKLEKTCSEGEYTLEFVSKNIVKNSDGSFTYICKCGEDINAGCSDCEATSEDKNEHTCDNEIPMLVLRNSGAAECENTATALVELDVTGALWFEYNGKTESKLLTCGEEEENSQDCKEGVLELLENGVEVYVDPENGSNAYSFNNIVANTTLLTQDGETISLSATLKFDTETCEPLSKPVTTEEEVTEEEVTEEEVTEEEGEVPTLSLKEDLSCFSVNEEIGFNVDGNAEGYNLYMAVLFGEDEILYTNTELDASNANLSYVMEEGFEDNELVFFFLLNKDNNFAKDGILTVDEFFTSVGERELVALSGENGGDIFLETCAVENVTDGDETEEKEEVVDTSIPELTDVTVMNRNEDSFQRCFDILRTYSFFISGDSSDYDLYVLDIPNIDEDTVADAKKIVIGNSSEVEDFTMREAQAYLYDHFVGKDDVIIYFALIKKGATKDGAPLVQDGKFDLTNIPNSANDANSDVILAKNMRDETIVYTKGVFPECQANEDETATEDLNTVSETKVTKVEVDSLNRNNLENNKMRRSQGSKESAASLRTRLSDKINNDPKDVEGISELFNLFKTEVNKVSN